MGREKTQSRRSFLEFLIWGGGTLLLCDALQRFGFTLPSVDNRSASTTVDQEPKSPQQEIREKRNLKREIVIIGGGTNEVMNYSSFYLDVVLWYYIAKDILAVPKEHIHVYYYNGRHPANAKTWLLDNTYNAEQRAQLENLLQLFPPEDIVIRGDIRKETLLRGIQGAAQKPNDQLLVLRSGHGYLRWPGNETRSIMMLPNEEYLDNVEFADALTNNQAKSVITFLNQCMGTFFLEPTVSRVPNLAVFTADGADGKPENAWFDSRIGFEWPWSKAQRMAMISPIISDRDRDGKISLTEIADAILTNDTMHTTGYYTEAWGRIKTSPGIAFGSAINPNEVLLQYQ